MTGSPLGHGFWFLRFPRPGPRLARLGMLRGDGQHSIGQMQHIAPAPLIDRFVQRRQGLSELGRAIREVLLESIHAGPTSDHPPYPLEHLLG